MAATKQQVKLLLIGIIAFLAVLVLILSSEKNSAKIPETSIKQIPSEGSSSSDRNLPPAVPMTIAPQPIPITEPVETDLTPLPSEEDERAMIENMNWSETNKAEPELEDQIKNESTEIPDDLKAQLEQGEIPIPEDLQRQLDNDTPEIPDDIQKALETPPEEIPSPEEENSNQ